LITTTRLALAWAAPEEALLAIPADDVNIALSHDVPAQQT
jgi:hypothetical protein